MRLIDGDALVEFWSADFTEEEIHKLHIPLAVAIENIKDAPTIDAVPVVQCKDCRHRDPEDHKCDSGEDERQGCPFKVADDYFCAYGER